MAAYPAGLPAPLLAPYANQTATGVTAVQFERGNRRQRRTARKDRQIFSLSFVFTMTELWTWQSWANRFGYDWHSMDLASAWSGLSDPDGDPVPHTIRYTSDIAFEAVAPGVVRVSVEAEMDVSTLPQGVLTPSGNWYVAGTPASPSANYLVAGTPASPSSDVVVAGTPALPAA